MKKKTACARAEPTEPDPKARGSQRHWISEWVVNSFHHLVDLGLNFFSKTRWDRTLHVIRGHPLQ